MSLGSINGFYSNIAKIKNNSVVIYRKWEGDATQKMKNCNLLDNFTAGDTIKQPYCGQMTKEARKRMIAAIELFTASIKDRWIFNKYLGKRVKHNFSFITLTIPEQTERISGKDGYNNLLEPFLFWLVKTKKVNTYIWKGELQAPLDFQGKVKTCKGQLHYHILVPNFIAWQEIRAKWNYLLEKNNLLGGHIDPPSTSIERPYKTKNVSDYIIKEISKNCVSTKEQKNIQCLMDKALRENKDYLYKILSNELERLNFLQKLENENLGGKVWGCSKNLQPKKQIKQNIDFEIKSDIEKRIKQYEKQVKENKSKPEKLAWDKGQLNWLRKSYVKQFYEKQKSCYEVEFTDGLLKRLNLTMDIYEERGDWDKSKNIWENDFVTIYKLPSDYKDILLDTKHINESGENVFYKTEYKEFIKSRVGVVFTEKTMKKTINKYAEIT